MAGRDGKKHFASPEDSRKRWKGADHGGPNYDEPLEKQWLLGMFLW